MTNSIHRFLWMSTVESSIPNSNGVLWYVARRLFRLFRLFRLCCCFEVLQSLRGGSFEWPETSSEEKHVTQSPAPAQRSQLVGYPAAITKPFDTVGVLHSEADAHPHLDQQLSTMYLGERHGLTERFSLACLLAQQLPD